MRRKPASPGFSLVEILVALTVAAILSLALIAAQRRAFEMAENGAARWRCLNLAMSLLVENPPSRMSTPTGGWVQRALPPVGEWRMEREFIPGAGSWQTLSTRSGPGQLTFEWPAPDFSPRVP